MRAPYQILAIPYRIDSDGLRYCVFHRVDPDMWQFIAGGGEDDETPKDAAKREIFEESGITASDIIELKTVCSIPTSIFTKEVLQSWAPDTYVVPEYSFGFECRDEIKLSHEHDDMVWLYYEDAKRKLTFDSNRTALHELNCRLTKLIDTKTKLPTSRL